MNTLGLYFRLISIRIRSQMQYPASFVFDVIGTGFGTAIYFATLAAVFARFNNIGGWTLGEVAFLYGLAEMAFATMDMIFSYYAPDAFSGLVQRGAFDQMLLRPLGLPLQIFSTDFVLRRLGRVAQGMVIFGLGLYLTHAVWTPLKWLYLAVVFASTVAFFGGLFVAGSTTCFWTVERVEAINIFTYGGTELISYPMHIYNDWIRRFFTFVVPAALLTYYPALYFLDKPILPGPAWLPFLSPLAGFGTLALAFAFWNFGVKKYTSTGT
jgi:ABC-2 type transport system permease protein